MKQLKFMLAAATAIGLATAAQAATTTSLNLFGDTEPVDTFEAGTQSADLIGYRYLSDDGENDSKVEDGTLKVSTGENPYLRALDLQDGVAASVDMTATGFESLYIDTEVQFTVTPAGDDVTEKAGDKLMIYLAEFTNGVEGASSETPVTNLVVKAASWDQNTEMYIAKDYIVASDIKTNTWYQLKVVAKLFGETDAYYPAFGISIAEKGEELNSLSRDEVPAFDEVVGELVDDPSVWFPSLSLVGANEAIATDSLTYVGFAGEGAVDNLTAVKLTVVNSVDFTFTWSGDGISAVTYTIGEGDDSVTSNIESGVKFSVDPGASFTVNVTLKPWYKLEAETVYTYTDVAEGDEVDLGSAVKIAEVDADGNVAVTENATAADVQAAANITTGSFAESDVSKAKLQAVLNWKNANKTAAIDINKMSFDTYGNPNSTIDTDKLVEEAYLLNCAPTAEALQVAKEAFVFTAEDLAALIKDGVKAGLDVADGGYNGEVVIQGCDDLATAEWADKAAGDMCNFYRARLKFTK